MFENENLLKIIFSGNNIHIINQNVKQIRNKILFSIVLRMRSFEKMFKFIGQTKHTLFNIKQTYSSFDILPNGSMITAIIGKALKCWDINTYSCTRTIKGYSGRVYLLDNKRLAVVSKRQIQILNLETFEYIKSISMHPYTGFHNPVILSNGHLALNCVYQRHTPSIIILDCNNDYSCKKIISCGDGAFYSPIVSLNGDLLATRRFKYIEIYKAGKEYECVKFFKGHQRHIECLIHIKDFLISSSFDLTIRIWDLKDDYKCIKTISDDIVSSLLALPGGFFASYNYVGKIKIWDILSFRCLNVIIVDKLVYHPKMALLKDNRIVVQLDKKIIILEH
jgi:WD40 repeat protein